MAGVILLGAAVAPIIAHVCPSLIDSIRPKYDRQDAPYNHAG